MMKRGTIIHHSSFIIHPSHFTLLTSVCRLSRHEESRRLHRVAVAACGPGRVDRPPSSADRSLAVGGVTRLLVPGAGRVCGSYGPGLCRPTARAGPQVDGSGALDAAAFAGPLP